MRTALAFFLLINLCANAQTKWSADKANNWAKDQPWFIGCNYIPATAINELEMWQRETFDTVTIQNELALAHTTGFNIIRVFLHETVYRYDSVAFKKRIDVFLSIAERNKIKVMFVLFDDCWNANPKPGPQPAPKPGVHNSGWVQCPGKTDVISHKRWADLEKYTVDIISTFANDKRIVVWDVYNEPGNSGLFGKTVPLLRNVFKWAREAKPGQPLTSGVFAFKATHNVQLSNSDIITFHNYSGSKRMAAQIKRMKLFNRPVICTEYMARTSGSTFKDNLPVLARENVGAINWGFVKGKTQTIYPWTTWIKPMTSEPAIWFHDIYRTDSTAFDNEEVKLIQRISAEKNQP